MSLLKCFIRTNLWKKYILSDLKINCLLLKNKGFASSCHRYWYSAQLKYNHVNEQSILNNYCWPVIHRKWFSKGLIDGDTTQLMSGHHEKELKKIKELFPQPRVTLNELATKTPEKIFEIHYKQIVMAPKSGRKKGVVNNDWMCTYAFVWPEKMKFECIAISKRQAAEKAATQSLHWLYTNRRIDNKGSPIYEREVLEELQGTLNEPLHANISDKTVERIDRIWNDYENGIKDIYEATFKEAKLNIQTPAFLTKDSTIDEDGYPEDDPESGEEVLSTIGPDLETYSTAARCETGRPMISPKLFTAALEDVFKLLDWNLFGINVNGAGHKPIHPVYGRHISPPSKTTLDRRERTLRETFQRYDEELTPLPIDEHIDKITSTLEHSRVLVLVGAAGCGKSTRAPAAILRRCGVNTAAIVSEPRRLAAIGLAERVADEMREEVGQSIGYQVRLQSRVPRPPAGSVLYCTSGVLLRRLHDNPSLAGCSHVVVDEAHERDVNTDLTLLLLRRALRLNPQLRVLIMSATLDTQLFTRYFDSCPVIEVPGRTYPVEVLHLQDIQSKFNIQLPNTLDNCNKEERPIVHCNEVSEVIKAVDSHGKEGAILVFLPGWAEIKLTKRLLDEHYGQSSLHLILPVHSRLSTSEQARMFSRPALGVRKIVLSTNVAETSVTVPDVVHVIDAALHKENTLKEGTGTASLETVWISQASAKQRAGRAGRVQPGVCYRLYTKEKEAEFALHTTPEILRVPLDQTVLECKTYAPDERISVFLSELPEPPTKQAIKFAIDDLVDLGALTPTEQVTRLGSLLSRMSVSPRMGRSLLHSAVLGNIVPLANVAVHCADNVELFNNAPDRREEIRTIKRKYSATSDHSALHWLQHTFEELVEERGWKHAEVENWCETHGVRKERLGQVKSLSNLYLEQVLKFGMEPSPDAAELNRFSEVDELCAATLLSGSNKLLVTRRCVNRKGKLKTMIELFTSTGERAHIGGESVNYGITKRSISGASTSSSSTFSTSTSSASIPSTRLLAHGGGRHSAERRALVVYKTSVVTPLCALLFTMGNVHSLNMKGGDNTVLSVPRHGLHIHVPNSQSEKILKTREMLWNTLQYYIERDTSNVDYNTNTTVARFKVRLVKAIGRMLVEADRVQDTSPVDDEDFR